MGCYLPVDIVYLHAFVYLTFPFLNMKHWLKGKEDNSVPSCTYAFYFQNWISNPVRDSAIVTWDYE